MDVHVLIREDQNAHGFVDTSVEGVFGQEDADASAAKERCKSRTRELKASRVWGDAGDWHESDWEVSWMIERMELH